MVLESNFHDIQKKKCYCSCEGRTNTDNSLSYNLWILQRPVIVSEDFLMFSCVYLGSTYPLLVFNECFLTSLIWERNTTKGKSFNVLQSPTSVGLNFQLLWIYSPLVESKTGLVHSCHVRADVWIPRALRMKANFQQILSCQMQEVQKLGRLSLVLREVFFNVPTGLGLLFLCDALCDTASE